MSLLQMYNYQSSCCFSCKWKSRAAVWGLDTRSGIVIFLRWQNLHFYLLFRMLWYIILFRFKKSAAGEMNKNVSEENPWRMKPSRVRTQANICVSILAETLDGLLMKNIPADQFLAHRFRNDRRLGSRDRRLITRIIFSVFRQFGFLRSAFGDCMQSTAGVRRHLLLLYMLGATVLEGFTEEVCDCWLMDISLSKYDFKRLFELSDELERFQAFVALAGMDYKGGRDEILPGWTLPELAVPFHEQFYEVMRTRPPMWLRAQTDDIEKLISSLAGQGLYVRQHPKLSCALVLRDAHVNLNTIDAFRKGEFELQDISSQCIGLACKPSPGEHWWDACSGGGGKALQLASLMRRKGTVAATDIREYKLLDLKKRAARAAFPNIHIAKWDGKELSGAQTGIYSGVLVDAPCSSSGRWRRNPDARWAAVPGQLEELSRIQLEILGHASRAVRPGGVLVYATCSMFRRENTSVVEAFLKTHPEFCLEPFQNPLTGVWNDGMQQIMPWDADCDASFAARMRRI